MDASQREARRAARRRGDGSIVAAVRGPITLITIGVLFALHNFSEYSFQRTWPVILIVFGALSLIRRTTEPAYIPPQPPLPPNYPYNPPPPGASYDPRTGAYVPPQSTTSYSGSRYDEPPASAPGRGGFGSSAPGRTPDSGPEPTSPPAAPGGAV